MNRQLIHKGSVVDLGCESVTLPNGKHITLDIVRHTGGAAVVAINQQNEVCLLRQYRHAADGWLWELPAGKIDPNEQPEVTAIRELAEEAGVTTDHLTSLGKIITTPGFCDETIFLYLATDLSTCGTQQEDHEVIEIHWINFDDATAMIYNGDIIDAKTIVALLYASHQINH